MSEYPGAGVGGGHAYRSEERVLVVAKWVLGQWAVRCWRIEDCGDGDRAADGACKRWPPGLCSHPRLLPRCDRAQNRDVMANGEVQRPIHNV